MTDRMKHLLYDTFLKETPIAFESVTDEQWEQMRCTVVGMGISLRMAAEEFNNALANMFKGGKK